MKFIDIFTLSFIEGITEYLPISSTGHLILTSHFLGIQSAFVTQFNIIIQFGAILAVLFLYWKKFFPVNLVFYSKIFVAFLPAAVLGLLVKNKIDALLESVTVVAWALLVGGALLIWIERKLSRDSELEKITDETTVESHHKFHLNTMTLKQALGIGLFQCFAFIPGVSRSAATIVGGILLGLDKKHATEFSFFLALPTLAGATLLKTIKIYPTIDQSQIFSLLLGVALSFAFAILAIRSFVALISSRKGVFQWFGIYRIILGGMILWLI